MNKLRKKLHLSEDGFSLMELIVTMLVSSVVIAAVAGFLSAGLRYYQNADAETTLQTESQIAELFLTELFQESADYKVYSASDYPVDVTYAFEVKRDMATSNVSVVILKSNGQLWYADVPESVSGVVTTPTERMNTVITKGRSEAFLASYVESVILYPENWSEAMANGQVLKLSVNFDVADKEYKKKATIALRNVKRN